MGKQNLWWLGAVVTLGACGQQGPVHVDEAAAREVFEARAIEVAAGWPQAKQQWPAAPVLLDNPVTWDAIDSADESAQAAFDSGRYELSASLPESVPEAEVTHAGGDQQVEMWSAERAFARLAVAGQPPDDCPRSEPEDDKGADDEAATGAQAACGTLTITEVKAGTDRRWTSRGMAEVPVWKYTVDGYREPISQLAYASAQHDPVTVEVPDAEDSDVRKAEQLRTVDEDEITYTISAGGCSVNERPLVHETDEVVVVAGIADRKAEVCTMQAGAAPVTARLADPIGERMIVDADSGTVLNHQDPFPQPPHNYDAGPD